METIKEALFLFGNHPLTLDEKNRLPIPATIKKALDPERDGDAFFVVDGVNLRLWLYPDKSYRAMVSKLSSEIAPGPAQLEFDHWNFGSAECVEVDGQGRVRIPDKLLKIAGLKNKEVMLVGARNHMELWDRADWDAHFLALREARRKGASPLASTSVE